MKTDLICHIAEAIVAITILVAMAFYGEADQRAKQFEKAFHSCSDRWEQQLLNSIKNGGKK